MKARNGHSPSPWDEKPAKLNDSANKERLMERTNSKLFPTYDSDKSSFSRSRSFLSTSTDQITKKNKVTSEINGQLSLSTLNISENYSFTPSYRQDKLTTIKTTEASSPAFKRKSSVSSAKSKQSGSSEYISSLNKKILSTSTDQITNKNLVASEINGHLSLSMLNVSENTGFTPSYRQDKSTTGASSPALRRKSSVSSVKSKQSGSSEYNSSLNKSFNSLKDVSVPSTNNARKSESSKSSNLVGSKFGQSYNSLLTVPGVSNSSGISVPKRVSTTENTLKSKFSQSFNSLPKRESNPAMSVLSRQSNHSSRSYKSDTKISTKSSKILAKTSNISAESSKISVESLPKRKTEKSYDKPWEQNMKKNISAEEKETLRKYSKRRLYNF